MGTKLGRKFMRTSIFFFVMIVSGCASQLTWTDLEGMPANNSKVEQAIKNCDYRRQMNSVRDMRRSPNSVEIIGKIIGVESRQILTDMRGKTLKEAEKIADSANSCMKEQGLTKG